MACHDWSRASSWRALSFRSFCGLLRSKSMSIALRQSEHALGDDVALDFAGSGLNGIPTRPQIGVLPHAVVEIDQLPVRPKDLLRDLLRALVHLAPVDLLDRSLRARHAALGERRQRAIRVQAEDLQLQVRLRELLPHDRIGAGRAAVAV